MGKSLYLIRRPSVKAVVVIFVMVIVFGSIISTITLSKMSQAEFPVKNLSPGFQVVEFSQADRVVRLKLTNNYPKGITAYVLTASRGRSILTHSIDSIAASEPEDRVWRTGEVAIFEGEIYGPAGQHDLTIRTVVFEDLTSDGEAEYAQKILDKRRGDKLLFDEILPQLQALKVAGDKFVLASGRVPSSERAALPESVSFTNKLVEIKDLASTVSRQRHRNLPSDVEAAYRTSASFLHQSIEDIETDAKSEDPKRAKSSVDGLEAKIRRMRDSL